MSTSFPNTFMKKHHVKVTKGSLSEPYQNPIGCSCGGGGSIHIDWCISVHLLSHSSLNISRYLIGVLN